MFLSLWIVVEYFLINWPHFRLPAFVYKMRYVFRALYCYLSHLRAKVEKTILKGRRGYSMPHLTCIDVGILSISTLFMLMFLSCSICGLVFQGYFYCFCLLFIVVSNDILKRVLRAVTKNGVHITIFMMLELLLFRYIIDMGCCLGSDCPIYLCHHLICFPSESF